MSMLHAKCCETLRDAYESPSLGDWWLEDVAVDFFNKQPIGQELIAAGTSIEPLRDRSAQVYTWILMLLSGRFFKCHFVPPPLLNMLFTNLNAGMMRFHSALTVKNTEFPSPFTEIVTNLSTLMGFLIPIVIHPLLDFMVWKFLLCMVGMYGYMVTAAVAKMLQDPFGEDEFDHSVDQYQIDFDLCMMDVCDKMSYHTPFPSVRRMGHKVPRYNKPDGEPIDIFLREQADVIRWNTAAPKAPELRVGVTRGALRAIQRKRQEKDSFSSDDSCIPFENELKPRRRAQLLEEQEKRLAERKKRKDDLEKLAMQRRMVRAVMKIEALAILHFHFKYGRDDFGTEGRVASLERKRLAALANQVEESEESAPGTYRRFGAKKGELDHIPGRSRTSVARHRADREK
ncbi:unnamed protein product [Amoebophrya sp. A25]|nr:unnamed protein product [Amoebophrya sp. A25]|eukprot:GSA25T00010898001.1